MYIIQNTNESFPKNKSEYMHGENNKPRCYVKMAAGKQIPHYTEQDLIFCYEFRVLFLLVRQG